jgi:formylglycine-generating enzyme required for sulfatase activity
MAKVALLIGVSEYEPGLNALPAAVKDVEAMQRVLVHPEMGGFAEENITVLKNPQKYDMEAAIYRLFANRQKDDLLLFYFSGHGVKDDSGKLYLSTRATHKENGKLVKYSAVAASILHDSLNDSKSQRQVLILDCCFSGAIAQGLTVKDDGNVNVQEHLGGKGRAILTASTSTQYSFEQEGSELSVYTRYLVEGIEKGAADQDGDGWISVDELHDYASIKVTEAAPAMTPKFYPVEGGYRIRLAKSPKDDPRVKYRKEVERRINRGKFSIPARRLLNSLQLKLDLDAEVAAAIEAEVQQPYQEYQRKLAEYEETLVEAIEAESMLSESTLNDLRDYQQHLGLRDEDVAPIEQRLMGQQKAPFKVDQSPPELGDLGGECVSPNTHTSFTEDLANGVTLEMIAIPGGTFLMGSPESELERAKDEGPQHTVTLQPFFMGKSPVTQAQWQAVASLPKVKIDLDPDPSEFKGANRPVEQVSWYEAVEFCARLSKATGREYRLPSEAEWEYACRAGTTTPFHFGETISPELANYNGNYTYASGSEGIYREQTTEVGSFPANAFELYDMHGNVDEWCADHWHESYDGAPTDGSVWLSEDENEWRLLRGGSWCNLPEHCRSAYRNHDMPVGRFKLFGFRVVGVRG